MKKRISILSITLYYMVLSCYAQNQIGNDIDGEMSDDNSGYSVSMSHKSTVAIGAYNNDGNGSNAGHVRIYKWNGSMWGQKGLDLDGEGINDLSGQSVSMPDTNTVAIGARWNSDNGFHAGHVRVYSWNGSVWGQKGADIDGEVAGDESGYSVSMPDINTVAIGAIGNSVNGQLAGHVRIFSWNGSAWVQKGVNINGESSYDESGCSVSMPNANTIAIGAYSNDGNGINAGHVRIFSWNGSTWVQKGVDIDGEAPGDYSGKAISMPDSNTVAIGATNNDANGSGFTSGHVRIFGWSGSAWVQKGIDIDGAQVGASMGASVSMPNPNTIAIGSSLYYGYTGHVGVYWWDGNSWLQDGIDIKGEASSDFSGFSVSMPDAYTVAIGANLNDGNGVDAGHVRAFKFDTIRTQIFNNIQLTKTIMLYPNPFNKNITLVLPKDLNLPAGQAGGNTQIRVVDLVGKEVYRVQSNSNTAIQIDGSQFENGIYIIELSNSENVIGRSRIVKQ